MSKKPTLRKPEIDLTKLDQFASRIETEPTKEETSIVKPWENPRVRDDVIKGIGVPLSEPHLMKLQFISKHTKYSMRKYCQIKLERAIDREVRLILKALESGQEYWSEPE